jgi:hypothetical protein
MKTQARTVNENETRKREIEKSHEAIINSLKPSAQKAIKIGQLLAEQKATLGANKDEFDSWVNNNLPFTYRTAKKYMKLWRKSHKLKEVPDLNSAYILIEAGKIRAMKATFVILTIYAICVGTTWLTGTFLLTKNYRIIFCFWWQAHLWVGYLAITAAIGAVTIYTLLQDKKLNRKDSWEW